MDPIKPHIITFMNAYSQGISGGDALFINYLLSIKNSHNISIVTSQLGQTLINHHLHLNNYIITSTESEFKHPILTYLIRTLIAIIKLWPTKTVDSIHSSSDFIPDVFPAFILKLLHPSAHWLQKIHHIIPDRRRLSYHFQIISFFFIKLKADTIETNSVDLKNQLINHYNFPATRIIVSIPTVDSITINQSQPSSTSYSSLFIGQLRQSKGIFDLIPIWQEVVHTFPNATLGIVGQDIDNNSQKLKHLITSNHLDKNICLLGFISPVKKFSLLKSAKTFILPSYEEGYGIVIAESLACRTPVFAYNLPIYNEHFKDKITTVPVGDTNSFAQAIINQLKHE